MSKMSAKKTEWYAAVQSMTASQKWAGLRFLKRTLQRLEIGELNMRLHIWKREMNFELGQSGVGVSITVMLEGPYRDFDGCSFIGERPVRGSRLTLHSLPEGFAEELGFPDDKSFTLSEISEMFGDTLIATVEVHGPHRSFG